MIAMKKLLIGLGVVGIFIVYSLGIRHQSPVIGKPKSLSIKSTPTATTTPAITSATTVAATQTASTNFKDGTYTGSVADAYYGNVQISATFSGGKITGVTFVDYPHTHSTSVEINQQAMPYLKQEAIQAQSSNVQIVSGATYTSQAFIQSLNSALSQAKA
jgi:uncharacterized protein with FMN-binding domain